MRRAFLYVLIASVGVSAVLGIIALLASRLGDSGAIEVEARWPEAATSRRHVIAIDDWHRL